VEHTPRLIASLLLVGLLLLTLKASHSQESVESSKAHEPPPIAPAESTQTGLLLEPPLDLTWYTREKFVAMSSTVGLDKIGKKWTSPVVTLPPHPREDVHGLTEGEVKDYMRNAKLLFSRGDAIPVSDVGLISTQEDVIRQPMLNHIAAFENSAVRVYLLVQRTASDNGWGYFSIVQDLTVDPPLDYYGGISNTEVKFAGASCYKCHSSGPLAIHPAREDLVLDSKLAAALSQYIAEQPRSRFHFPEHSPPPESGKPLTLSFCTSCHEEDGVRAPLYQVHSHPIRILVDFGYMPPDQRLTPKEIAELKEWLDSK